MYWTSSALFPVDLSTRDVSEPFDGVAAPVQFGTEWNDNLDYLLRELHGL